MTGINWAFSTGQAFTLNKNIHIWKVDYALFSGEEKQLNKVLNKEEKKRAGKFHFKMDRKRYIVTRALLKIILGRLVKNDPLDINFDYNAHGKPHIRNKHHIHFNVSHSADLGLLAVSDLAPVGIDVEHYRKNRDLDKIALRFFSVTEQKSFQKLVNDQKLQGFFNCWTRKEALIKALGLGLALPLKSFDVTLSPAEEARLIHIRYENEQARQWTVTNIPLDNDYAAAYAIKALDFKDYFWSVAGLI